MKDTEDYTSRWKGTPCSWIGKLIFLQLPTILCKAICLFSAISIKIPMALFPELEHRILKFVWKCKKPRVAKTILKKKNNPGGVIPLISNNITKLNSMILAYKQKHR